MLMKWSLNISSIIHVVDMLSGRVADVEYCQTVDEWSAVCPADEGDRQRERYQRGTSLQNELS